MIPVSLHIKNFLSYGEDVPPLDFSEFDVACLSGNNGHGKSAILDAMTWAIWGEARKAAGEKSPSDGLLRIGTPEMLVELVFDLEGDRYRAIRNYQRKNRRVRLDFQVFDEKTHAYKSLTEKTTRATQEKIDATLRMNYETFINSAFILQGRVDEFSKKTPRKRKEILAEILDLSRYDQLAELAKGYHREAKSLSTFLEEKLEKIGQELKHKAEYEQKLTELEQQRTKVDEKIQTHETQRQALEKQQAELQGKHTQLKDREQQRQQLENEIKRLRQKKTRQQQQLEGARDILEGEQKILERYNRYVDLQSQEKHCEEKRKQSLACQMQQVELERTIQQARHVLEKALEKWQTRQAQEQKILSEVQQLLHKQQQIDQGFRELQTARKEEDIRDKTRNQVDTLKESLRQIEIVIERQKNQLTVELQSLKRHIKELQSLAGLQPAREKDVQKCKEAVARLETLEKQREQSKEEGTECRSRFESLQEQQKRLQESVREIEEKSELLKRSDQPQCPLCSSELDAHKKGEIEEHFRQERENIQHEAQAVAKKLQEHDAYLKELRKQYTQFDRQIKKLRISREQHIRAENALRESQKAQADLEERKKGVSELQKHIENKAYAQAEHAKLADLQKRLETLAYNAKEHQSLKRRLKTLQKFERDYAKLEEARERQRNSLAQLPGIQQEMTSIRSTLDSQEYAQKERIQLQELAARIEEIGYDEQAHAQIQRELQSLQDASKQKFELDRAHEMIGVLQQTLDELVAEEQQKTESLGGVQSQIEALESDLTHLPAAQQALRKIKTGLESLNRERDGFLQEHGTYQNKHEHCKQLEIEAEEQHAKQKQAEKDSSIYGHLIRIFGKDGMQAYLIENAIPEIEDEANAILSRLTDNRTHITIESVKDLQKGGTKETLDIKISDELGTRSYELYSGGEAFRVDFAIRIALSKLLAKRAGTKLKTLVIDEGFGTQDAHGLDQLVEAIKTISVDFEKIVVITHLEALKEAFPVRIEVVKHPDIGSQYQIVR